MKKAGEHIERERAGEEIGAVVLEFGLALGTILGLRDWVLLWRGFGDRTNARSRSRRRRRRESGFSEG